MTPPKLEKVDIKALDSLYLENLIALDPDQAAKLLQGTDLLLEKSQDPYTGETYGELKRIIDGKGATESRSFEEEKAWIDTLRKADSTPDKELDLAEAKALLSSGLSEEQAKGVDPQKFLESVEALMAKRYRPLAANMIDFKAELGFKRTLDVLDQYNYGILIDEVRQAHSVFSLNSLTKTGVNIAAFIPYGIQRIWGEAPVLQGDAMAEEAAKSNYETRQAAIQELRTVIETGVDQGEAWALEGQLQEAMAQLDPETAALLENQLAVSTLDEILKLPDRKEAYERLLSFAAQERPGFLGFGGGNTSSGWFSSFWNYTGRRNNLYIAKTFFHFLGTKAGTEDPASDEALHQEARSAYLDMIGDGGGYNNLFAVGLTNVLCLGGAICETTPYRRWSDEDEMQAVGRAVDGALVLSGGAKGFATLSDAFAVGRLKGMGEVVRIWWGEGSLLGRLNPLGKAGWIRKLVPFGIWKEGRVAAEKEAAEFAKLGDELSKSKGRFGKFIEGVSGSLKEKLFKGIPPLSAEQSAMLKKVGETGGKGMDKLTKGVILLGILQGVDDKLGASFNPFEYHLKDLDREADFEAYPDPTLPDPTLTPASAPTP
ncbi:MAG: hypothetical protein K8R69_06690 [Deltaproteobacteria bacterium]|nr:hypothetical protein [Deltaproteobacteria bacterium]